ncbi:enoyl-CoA hydratase [Thalassobacillus devorans]|uniref:Enoyl-CoA hydratase n=1 Tax=Thalassobacillus devorans TaxID=279813 RepID=A0ABQ1P337_9BACI|nr:enoyl-CoA hydratase-related protein [Thalassobacillus devorans]NIK28037.1 enoyl-CoA hydratase/carnithine racemase [Thalassobacillus devorans]GGC89400.1 enoyl-CoA hydratase [Thalassobacillus devorans]
MSYQTIKYEIHKGIMTLILNRPEQMNTFTYAMSEELLDVLEWANQQDKIRVVIITGAGKAFCAGMDLSGGTSTFETDEAADDFRDVGGKVSLKVYDMKKPVIAAINGAAVGVGITLTLPMDIRIIKKGVKVGFVFGRVGIGPESVSGWFLPKLVGAGKALDWMLTGRYIPTDEAMAAGLIQYEEEDPLAKAKEIAEAIVQNTAATSNAFTRQILWRMTGESNPKRAHLIESKYLYWAARQADAKEGINAFLEKRSPSFSLSSNELPNFFL